MHLLLCHRGAEPFLQRELERVFPGSYQKVYGPGLLRADFVIQPEFPPILAFAQQLLVEANPCGRSSTLEFVRVLLDNAVGELPEERPWSIHVLAAGGATAGAERESRLVRAAFDGALRRIRPDMLRWLQLTPVPFTPGHSLVQLIMTSPNQGFLSRAVAPLPYQLRGLVSPFSGGVIPVASDKSAPSRAFAKLLEAEQRLGRQIAAGDCCVDLGAAPGSWTYVALHRGASVLAVDRTELRSDLMSHPNLHFFRGDAFSFKPERPVDWLLCDVIAAPERSINLLLQWTRHRLARRFVVTIKFKGTEDYSVLDQLKYALPRMCAEFQLRRLSSNKNEVCAFGFVENDRPCSR